MGHPALLKQSVATVTGGANGIGRAAAMRFAKLGMAIVLLDQDASALSSAESALRDAGAHDVMTISLDVSNRDALVAAEKAIAGRFGGTDILMNNAGIQPGSALFGEEDAWERVISVNLMGVIHGTRVFGPRMIERGRPGAIINTGSKQGITTPPGDPVYNTAKAGVKAFTEALAHDLRQTPDHGLTAHLLIPGFVFTALNARGRTEKPAAAWTPDDCAQFMEERMNAGDFYILCPDNDVTRDMDEKRMAWAIGDVIENRPALSRWHPDYADAFEKHMKS